MAASTVFLFGRCMFLNSNDGQLFVGGLEYSMSILLKFWLSTEPRGKLHNPNIYFNLLSNQINLTDFLLQTYLKKIWRQML